jgi:hypothetical protein
LSTCGSIYPAQYSCRALELFGYPRGRERRQAADSAPASAARAEIDAESMILLPQPIFPFFLFWFIWVHWT